MASKDHSSNLNDDSQDTISLCDLPVFGYDTNYTTTPSKDTIQDDESFEFFNQEWLKTNKDSNFFLNKDTLFGATLILPKENISRKTQQEFKKHDLDSRVCRNSEFAKLMSMNKGRNYSGKHETRRVCPASASVKTSWYYYGFGLAGIPAEMDLSTIKNRQSRHQKSRSNGSGKVEGGGFRQEKGLGRLIRDLSCDGQPQANSMVKASLVCLRRV